MYVVDRSLTPRWHHLISRSCGLVTIHGRRDFADMNKLRTIMRIILDYLDGSYMKSYRSLKAENEPFPESWSLINDSTLLNLKIEEGAPSKKKQTNQQTEAPPRKWRRLENRYFLRISRKAERQTDRYDCIPASSVGFSPV